MAPGLIELVSATLAVIGALCLKHFDDTRRWKTAGKVVDEIRGDVKKLRHDVAGMVVWQRHAQKALEDHESRLRPLESRRK